ncbi:zinc finger protein 444 isoform X1 [Sminthopsis crassicaudata]|uniref:zinc finger protein 444 isoform X1 n=1 Tax=Sminthopsis crassicaudata TaxID=9301 RepID=UPI003D695FB4
MCGRLRGLSGARGRAGGLVVDTDTDTGTGVGSDTESGAGSEGSGRTDRRARGARDVPGPAPGAPGPARDGGCCRGWEGRRRSDVSRRRAAFGSRECERRPSAGGGPLGAGPPLQAGAGQPPAAAGAALLPALLPGPGGGRGGGRTGLLPRVRQGLPEAGPPAAPPAEPLGREAPRVPGVRQGLPAQGAPEAAPGHPPGPTPGSGAHAHPGPVHRPPPGPREAARLPRLRQDLLLARAPGAAPQDALRGPALRLLAVRQGLRAAGARAAPPAYPRPAPGPHRPGRHCGRHGRGRAFRPMARGIGAPGARRATARRWSLPLLPSPPDRARPEEAKGRAPDVWGNGAGAGGRARGRGAAGGPEPRDRAGPHAGPEPDSPGGMGWGRGMIASGSPPAHPNIGLEAKNTIKSLKLWTKGPVQSSPVNLASGGGGRVSEGAGGWPASSQAPGTEEHTPGLGLAFRVESRALCLEGASGKRLGGGQPAFPVTLQGMGTRQGTDGVGGL